MNSLQKYDEKATDEGIDSDYQDDVQDEDSDRETDGKFILPHCIMQKWFSHITSVVVIIGASMVMIMVIGNLANLYDLDDCDVVL